MTVKFGFEPGVRVTIGGQTVEEWGAEPDPGQFLTANALKMNEISYDLVSVSAGHLSPTDDGGVYLNLTAVDPAVSQIEAQAADGGDITINVVPPRHIGWADGRNWMLPIDKATGLLQFEMGRKGRKFYVTKGAHGYTREMIAAEVGVSLSTVNEAYVRDSIYGRSPEKALHYSYGFYLWGDLTHNHGTSNRLFQSNVLLIEKGYDYTDHVWISNRGAVSRGMSGAGPLHPVVITSYGAGEIPRIRIPEISYASPNHSWFLFQDVKVSRLKSNSFVHAIASNVEADGLGGHFYLDGGYITIYRCGSHNPSSNPPEGATEWGTPPHDCSVYCGGSLGLLILETFSDQAGWRDGYNPESNSTEFPHPPSGLAHGLYIQASFWNVIARRNWISRSASMGIQSRPAGNLTDNILLDQNIILNQLGNGKSLTGADHTFGRGSFPLAYGNITLSNGYRDAVIRIYARDWGYDIQAKDGAAFDNIIMHRANPDDPAEIAAKAGANGYVFKDDTLTGGNIVGPNYIFNWNRPSEEAQGLSQAAQDTLMQTTLQRFAANYMSQTGMTEAEKFPAFCHWMRAQTPKRRMEVMDDFVEYTRSPWGIYLPKRINPTTCVFKPDTRGPGTIWADRINWSTGDTAGSVDGDTVELRGNAVIFGELTVDLAEVDGQGGKLEVASGKMTVDQVSNLTEVRTSVSGQIWIGAQTAVGSYIAESGRIAWTSAATGHNLTVNGQYPEVLLGPDHTIASGKVLDISCGQQGAVGWDGTGTATLTIASGGTLRMRNFAPAGMTVYAHRMSMLECFRSGALGDGETAPTVTVSLVLEAGAIVEVDTTGLVARTYDLTGPGVTVVDNGAILPAGVSVTGGKLVLVV